MNVTQTSAANIVSAKRLTESDLPRLVADFCIHPLDAERLLTVPERSTVERYHDYIVMSLLLPWPTAHGLVSLDVRLLVGQKFLIIVGDVPSQAVRSYVEALEPTNGDSPIGHAVAVLLSLSQATVRAIGAHAQQPAVVHELAGLRLALEGFPEMAERCKLSLTSDQRQQMALARHHLHVSSDSAVPTAIPLKAASRPNERAVVGYVAATAAVLLLTLLFRP